MTPLAKLTRAIGCGALTHFSQEESFSRRDEIKQVLSSFLGAKPTAFWLEQLQQHDVWAMPVLNWQELKEQEAYKVLQMEQSLSVDGNEITTTRCPIRINGERLFSPKAAPALGAHTEKIKNELLNEAL